MAKGRVSKQKAECWESARLSSLWGLAYLILRRAVPLLQIEMNIKH